MQKDFLVRLAQFSVDEDIFGRDYPCIFACRREDLIDAIAGDDIERRNWVARELMMNVLGYPHGRMKDILEQLQTTSEELEAIHEELLEATGFFLADASDSFAEMIRYLIGGETFGDMTSEEFVSHFEYDRSIYILVYYQLKIRRYEQDKRVYRCVELIFNYYEQNYDRACPDIDRYVVHRWMRKHYDAWRDYHGL